MRHAGLRHGDCAGAARTEALDALPSVLTMARRMVVTLARSGDPETAELKRLLEACVVGAHRLRLREHYRTKGVVIADDDTEY